MADGTKIEWAHAGLGRGASWNPIRARNRATGALGHYCEHASPGCVNCYSEAWNRDRLGTRLSFKPGHRADVDVFLDEQVLLQPLRWRTPRGIFVCSMTDAFGAFVTDAMLDRIFAVAALCPQHRFLFLTKRSARMQAYLSDQATSARIALQMGFFVAQHGRMRDMQHGDILTRAWGRGEGWPIPNVWVGVSAEDQTRADERIPDLLATPAAVRWVSAEPLLGTIDFNALNLRPWTGDPAPAPDDPDWRFNALTGEHWFRGDDGFSYGGDGPYLASLDWIVAGGESGPRARPLHPQWARGIRDQCDAAGVPFFFKQNGEFVSVSEVAGPGTHFRFPDGATVRRAGKRLAGRTLDGRTHDAMPAVAR